MPTIEHMMKVTKQKDYRHQPHMLLNVTLFKLQVMAMKPFSEFNKNVSWNTKFNILLLFGLVLFIYLFQSSVSTYALPAIFAILLVLVVNFAIKYFVDHPRVSNVVR